MKRKIGHVGARKWANPNLCARGKGECAFCTILDPHRTKLIVCPAIGMGLSSRAPSPISRGLVAARVPVPKKASARRQAPEHLLSSLNGSLIMMAPSLLLRVSGDPVPISADRKIPTSDLYMDVA